MSVEPEWVSTVNREMAVAENAWREGNAGMGRVGSRRAAGFAVRALVEGRGVEGYGKTLMHHLGALADAEAVPIAVRESAHRLAARKIPAEGFVTPFEKGKTTPMDDARQIFRWVCAELDVK